MILKLISDSSSLCSVFGSGLSQHKQPFGGYVQCLLIYISSTITTSFHYIIVL